MDLQPLGLGAGTRTRQLRVAAGELGQRPRGRSEVTGQVRERLAFWRGNVAAVHRDLVEAARGGGPAAPSRQAPQRAVGRDVLRGDRAGLRSGELARRAHDVFLQRPRGHRNEVREAGHVEAPVEVDVEGRLIKPRVTWLVDAGQHPCLAAAS
jgi:putative transposase